MMMAATGMTDDSDINERLPRKITKIWWGYGDINENDDNIDVDDDILYQNMIIDDRT